MILKDRIVPNIKPIVRREMLFKCIVAMMVLCLGWLLTQSQTIHSNLTDRGVLNQQSDNNASSTQQSPAHKYFTDVLLVNQNGEKMRFYSDLLRGKVVIINSFFATCQGSCLPLTRNLEKVQEALGDRLGKDVYIISISVDPTVDSAGKLKEYAKKLHARSGWYFLTGDKQNVDLALNKIGQFVNDKENHVNIFIIGNERTGLWKKAFGLARSDELVRVVESVLNDKPVSQK
jgi:protein SCO1